MRKAATDDVRGMLRDRHRLADEGRGPRQIAAALADGSLRRIRRGHYIEGETWAALRPEDRHLAHVLAVAADAVGAAPLFCGVSAAVIHGLPLYRVEPRRVHTLADGRDRRSAADVFRHEDAAGPADVSEVDGLRCTSLARTVFDIARLCGAEVAIACADAALSRIGGDARRFDDEAAQRWHRGVTARAEVPGMRGIRHARAVLGIADGRAQLPLEAVTTLQLWRLGFARPRLQVPVPDPHGGTYWMDLEIPGADAFYECDGRDKYTDAALRAGRSLDEVLLAEKAREDWVRGVTGRRVLRGDSADSASPAALAARLSRFGVALPPRRPHPSLPRRPLAYGL